MSQNGQNRYQIMRVGLAKNGSYYIVGTFENGTFQLDTSQKGFDAPEKELTTYLATLSKSSEEVVGILPTKPGVGNNGIPHGQFVETFDVLVRQPR